MGPQLMVVGTGMGVLLRSVALTLVVPVCKPGP